MFVFHILYLKLLVEKSKCRNKHPGHKVKRSKRLKVEGTNEANLSFYPLTFNVRRYIFISMIQTFKCKETEKIFNRHFSKKFPNDIQRPALRKLRMLNRARTLKDLLAPPGNRLESLHGDRKGQHSIRINDQWRICFKWHNNNAYVVEIADYH